MSTLNAIRESFFEECEDLLEGLVEGLTVIDQGSWDSATVNAVFRAVHSIKGGAGAFGLDDLVTYAHTFETVLDELRSDRLEVTQDLVQVFFRASDQLTNLVEAARDDTGFNTELRDASLSELSAYLGVCDQPADEEPVPEFEAMTLDFDAVPLAPENEPSVWRIDFAPMRSLFANGHEPARIFRHLEDLGTLAVTVDIEDLPTPEELDPDEAYFRWTLHLATQVAREEIEEAFDFVEGLCTLEIQDAGDPSPTPDGETDSFPPVVDDQPAEDVPPPETAPRPSREDTSGQPQRAAQNGPKATLRVELGRVDRLINTVGELIINQAMLSQRIAELALPKDGNVDAELENYMHLARDIQEGVMAIRAQPVKPLFQRMARIVREACSATGKRAELLTLGEGTEVDKTLIEQLADPLTHIIRNAVDHGLEDPATRAATGKPELGRIRLSATHRSGSIFIEVTDDGAGLNRPRILEIARSKGLVPASADFSEPEIDALLFMPGFSTAKAVSNLSGRGVGMDVVKNAIQSLGGRVSISSETGHGTTLTIILPLTLAVMDGMVVSVADQTLVVPISSVLETVRATDTNLHTVGPDARVLSIRGCYVPIIDVGETLGFYTDEAPGRRDVLILVETEQNGQCALALDAIHDQRQVVIKSIEGNYGTIPGISAATILGDGKIALILDPESVAQGTARPGLALAPQLQLQDA